MGLAEKANKARLEGHSLYAIPFEAWGLYLL